MKIKNLSRYLYDKIYQALCIRHNIQYFCDLHDLEKYIFHVDVPLEMAYIFIFDITRVTSRILYSHE